MRTQSTVSKQSFIWTHQHKPKPLSFGFPSIRLATFKNWLDTHFPPAAAMPLVRVMSIPITQWSRKTCFIMFCAYPNKNGQFQSKYQQNRIIGS